MKKYKTRFIRNYINWDINIEHIINNIECNREEVILCKDKKSNYLFLKTCQKNNIKLYNGNKPLSILNKFKNTSYYYFEPLYSENEVRIIYTDKKGIEKTFKDCNIVIFDIKKIIE